MITVHDIVSYLETVAPEYMKMDWDNVGLLCGRQNKEVRTVLVALDPFENVCWEAVSINADLIVTHHPLIFQPPRTITDSTSVGKCILMLAANDISAFNLHTNLDCAPGGVNDVLAETLGLENVCVIPQDEKSWGLLRCGTVPQQDLNCFLKAVKSNLGCDGLRYVDGGKPVHRVAVGGGACGDCLLDAFDAGCDTFVTADVKYNQFRDSLDLGINLIDAGHFHTENPVVAVIAGKLQAAFPEICVKIAQSHTDCMKFY